jgi:hypothetical protein
MSTREAAESEDNQFKQFYYVRRSLVTLQAFRDNLNELSGDAEYRARRPFIPTDHLDRINAAHSFLNKNDVLRRFRNDLGAHMNPALVKAAVGYHGENAIAAVGWRSSPESFDIEMPFATALLRGGFASKLPGGIPQLNTDMNEFFGIMTRATEHITHATYALVLVFLWDRFGGGPG